MVLVWQRICLVRACDPCTGLGTQQVLSRWGAEKEQVEEGIGIPGPVSHSPWLPGESGVTRGEQSSC